MTNLELIITNNSHKHRNNINNTQQQTTILSFSVQNILAVLILSIALTLLTALVLLPTKTYALDNNFSDGITVDSKLDTADSNVGDNICNDGSGNCTLRAAIEESNATAGAQTIKFNLTGTADFTNGGQNGYTIQPTSSLPDITDTVTIDGYTQPGSQPNTAIAPQPLNGILLIEVDGNQAGSSTGIKFTNNSDNSEIKGLVINNFSGANAIELLADNIKVQGNYIGTNPTGTTAKPNLVGVNAMTTDPVNMGKNALIGGLNPADRNLISGNSAGNGSGGYPGTGWVIQGNYVGVGTDGLTPIPNSMNGGSGALSVDDCSDVLIGGNQPGATNVVSGNLSHGLAPFNSPGTIIRGNLIGTDWTGKIAVPNESGIVMGDNQTGSIIGGETDADRNIISGNQIVGIASDGTGGLRIEGNYIGLDIDGKIAIPNNSGVLFGGNMTLGGSENARNVISGNTVFNVSVQGILAPSIGGEISGNYIGTNADGDIDPAITNVQGEGIRVSAYATELVIGGAISNRIAGNRDNGIAIRSFTVTNYAITASPSKISVLGNQIYGNATGSLIPSAQGLGIDIYTATIANMASQPTMADYQAESYTNLGPTPNDTGDTDTGPNSYMNYPVLASVAQQDNNVAINYSLDALDSPTNQYRVEFFANDTADPSGYGEGQTYLGSATTAPGTNLVANLTIPNGTNLNGKHITATTTAIDNTTTSGFGSTSEFSRVTLASATFTTPPANNTNNTSSSNSSTNGSLSNTGQDNIYWLIASGLVITVSSLWLLIKRNKYIRCTK